MKFIKITGLIFALSFSSHQAFAQQNDDFITRVLQRVGDSINADMDRMINDLSYRYGILFSVGLFTTINGAAAATALPGVYTTVEGVVAIMSEITHTVIDNKDLVHLKDDALEYLTEGRASYTFEEFAHGVRTIEGAHDLSDEQIAAMVLTYMN